MFRFLASLLVSLYLHAALRLGFHRHVYRLTNKWLEGGLQRPIRGNTAANIQDHLFFHGYHRCPSCHCATELPNEHVEVQGSWCWEQTLPKCTCCGHPERECQMPSQADIKAYMEEQQLQEQQREEQVAAAWTQYEADEADAEEFFKEEELRRQSEWEDQYWKDEEAIRAGKCLGCGTYQGCTC